MNRKKNRGKDAMQIQTSKEGKRRKKNGDRGSDGK
jgi:hypothetical protein